MSEWNYAPSALKGAPHRAGMSVARGACGTDETEQRDGQVVARGVSSAEAPCSREWATLAP